ncbi:hypothetical protein [Ectopseudomonas guguanensis]|jgi:hypothetical protein|uniref:Uncharacterized protein n=1 Tax=Ectopseudomonas guguanensis TaxID=1198456 RepID=A0A1H0XHK9_9GAMM|nr:MULTISPECIES: hypothetical protein [Pseudomonas]MDR8013445.1 hypothetical protein [Pseudomonas guguanensis]MPT20196.1 hypothetical protein [Pseudomonas sp.]WJH54772.1 hypothetical protein FE254_00870 [Pseudomonas guguanensis]SDQ02430.1 hypothetical protein SAMN05216213_12127 [Pseudomonas guguanensis]
MSQPKQCGISGGWLLTMLATALAMLLGMLALWLNFLSSAELQGRYQSTGQVQLSNGQVLDISHSLQVNNGRFYAMTRQGDSILETSGVVDYGFLGNYRLRVEDGQVTGLASEIDDELVFNLLYGRHKGSTIRLTSVDSCLYALETRQVYCPARTP